MSESSEIQINIKGPSELKLQITISTDKTVLELKQAIAEKSNVEADRQRLIYSGRVLKDEEQLSVYKIQASHTIHMVKGAARSAASTSSSSSPAQPQPLPTMQTGQNVHDPLTLLNSHQGFGALPRVGQQLNDMGLNLNDPNMMQGLMNDPNFLQQMSSTLSNPAVLDQLIASNPQLAAMGPQVREVFQSERFRQMMSNPESLRTMMQMANLMGGADPFGFGGAGSASSFPAPGNPSTAQPTSSPTANNNGSNGQAGAGVPNPGFGGFPPMFGQNLGAGAGAGAGVGAGGAANPFGFNPALMEQLLAGFGGAGASPFGGFGGIPTPGGAGAGGPVATPADTRPPEERFQLQLQQLQDMGFTNASQNIRALLATGGNVHSAIEYILSGGGL